LANPLAPPGSSGWETGLGRGLSPPRTLKGRRNPKRGALGRETRGGGFEIDREGGPNPMRGTPKESRPWVRVEEEIPEGPSSEESLFGAFFDVPTHPTTPPGCPRSSERGRRPGSSELGAGAAASAGAGAQASVCARNGSPTASAVRGRRTASAGLLPRLVSARPPGSDAFGRRRCLASARHPGLRLGHRVRWEVPGSVLFGPSAGAAPRGALRGLQPSGCSAAFRFGGRRDPRRGRRDRASAASASAGAHSPAQRACSVRRDDALGRGFRSAAEGGVAHRMEMESPGEQRAERSGNTA
jgi:hypothetical protein